MNETMNKTNSKERCPYCGSIKKTGLRYLIAGAGGVGGNIAAFMWLAGKEVTCIARGEHLQAIHNEGLKLKSGLKGQHNIPITACTAEEYSGKADVIFVCVKGYSVGSIIELIKKAAHKDTIVIPILNVYGTGPKIQKLVPEVTVLDGCIYIVGFVSGLGEITQMGNIFRIVFGAHKTTHVNPGLLETIQKDLKDSAIKADISPDIKRDTFIKWSFISAMACTGSYYDVPMGEVQKEGKIRNTFTNLSKESAALGAKLNISFEEDLVTYNLSIIDKLSPETTASMQKDIERGHQSEIEGLLFEMIEMGESQGVEMPAYKEIAAKFKK